MKKFLFLSMIILTISSCVMQESERQKKINLINLQSKNLLDSALLLNPERNVYVGIRSLDTTGITAKYLKIRRDSAELGLIYARKLMVEIMQFKNLKDSIYRAYEPNYDGVRFEMPPYWSEDDCRKLKEGQIWIGMSLDMVMYLYQSRPLRDNVSDYGNGRQHQWLFGYGNSKYFYGGDDWIVTAYN